MRTMIVGLLCVMLGLGTVSGCGSSKSEPEQTQKETAAEDTEKNDDTQTTDSETEQTEGNGENPEDSSQTGGSEQGSTYEPHSCQYVSANK